MPSSKEIILNGKDKVLKKRQKETAPKIINKYKKITSDNKRLFKEYHNSFNEGKSFDTTNELINFFD